MNIFCIRLQSATAARAFIVHAFTENIGKTAFPPPLLLVVTKFHSIYFILAASKATAQ